MEEQASGSTDLPMRMSRKVTDKPRDLRQTCQNELMNLGAAVGPRLCDGCQNLKIGKSWKKSRLRDN